MIVKKLIEQLQKQDPRAIIILSRDAEGNDYQEFDEFEKNYWNGDDLCDEIEGKAAIVFYPI